MLVLLSCNSDSALIIRSFLFEPNSQSLIRADLIKVQKGCCISAQHQQSSSAQLRAAQQTLLQLAIFSNEEATQMRKTSLNGDKKSHISLMLCSVRRSFFLLLLLKILNRKAVLRFGISTRVRRGSPRRLEAAAPVPNPAELAVARELLSVPPSCKSISETKSSSRSSSLPASGSATSAREAQFQVYREAKRVSGAVAPAAMLSRTTTPPYSSPYTPTPSTPLSHSLSPPGHAGKSVLTVETFTVAHF